MFAVQDEITSAVVTAIVPAVTEAELGRILRKPPGSLGAWEAFQRGLWHFAKTNATDNEQAQKFLERAIELDSSFAPAYSALGLAYCHEGSLSRHARSIRLLSSRRVGHERPSKSTQTTQTRTPSWRTLV